MNRKRQFVMLLLYLLVFYITNQYYNHNFSQKGIFSNVTERNGYRLHVKQEQVPIESFISSDWIPMMSNERRDINEKLLNIHQTDIHLDNVINRESDIYFSFSASFHLNVQKGEFLYNGVFNEDGTFTSPSSGEISLYDLNGDEIKVGQQGFGPNADFSFGIQPEDYALIQDGFYVKYTGYILYTYIKNK